MPVKFIKVVWRLLIAAIRQLLAGWTISRKKPKNSRKKVLPEKKNKYICIPIE